MSIESELAALREEVRRLQAELSHVPARLAAPAETIPRYAKFTAAQWQDYEPTADNAVLCNADGEPYEPQATVKIYMDQRVGYFFIDDVTEFETRGGRRQALRDGRRNIGGLTNTTKIDQGTSASRVVWQSQSVDVYAVCGPVAASGIYGIVWDEKTKRWESDRAACAT